MRPQTFRVWLRATNCGQAVVSLDEPVRGRRPGGNQYHSGGWYSVGPSMFLPLRTAGFIKELVNRALTALRKELRYEDPAIEIEITLKPIRPSKRGQLTMGYFNGEDWKHDQLRQPL